MSNPLLLEVKNLAVTFSQYEVGLKQKNLTVITDLDLKVEQGQLVAVVGSSGSGKSLLAHALLGILPANATVRGDMLYKGQPLTAERIKFLRGREIALVPQSVGSLDPLQRVGAQVRRAGQLAGLNPREAARMQELTFSRYQLAPSVGKLFPFQVSGGMARRVLLSTALIGQAQLVVADEPTPGLHPAVVTETLDHLRKLTGESKGVILITHDLEAALRVADSVVVFYAGTTVEVARASDFNDLKNSNLRHPYTQALWQSLPQHTFTPLPGSQPAPDALPAGCLFAERCPLVTAQCQEERPQLREVRNGLVRCIRA